MSQRLLIDGDAPFLKREAVREILRKNADREVKRFWPGDSLAGLSEFAYSGFSFFGDKKLCVIEEVEKVKDDSGELTALLMSEPNESVTVILVTGEGTLDKRLKLSKLIQSACKTHTLSCPQRSDDWAEWFVKRAAKLGKTISTEDARLVIRFVGKDHANLDRELRKVCLYLGEKDQITRQDLGACLIRHVQHEVWEVTDAFGRKDLARLLTLVRRFTEDNGEEAAPLILASSFFKFIEKLLVAVPEWSAGTSAAKIADMIGERFTPYFEEKYQAYVGKWTPTDLQSAYTKLCTVDLNIKQRGFYGPDQLDWFLVSTLGLPSENS